MSNLKNDLHINKFCRRGWESFWLLRFFAGTLWIWTTSFFKCFSAFSRIFVPNNPRIISFSQQITSSDLYFFNARMSSFRAWLLSSSKGYPIMTSSSLWHVPVLRSFWYLSCVGERHCSWFCCFFWGRAATRVGESWPSPSGKVKCRWFSSNIKLMMPMSSNIFRYYDDRWSLLKV